MKIDWKKLAKTEGYKSLKAAYIKSVKREGSKGRFLRKFYWVVNRAKNYSHSTKIPVDVVLTEWEKNRSYGWLNYYSNPQQPRIKKKNL